MSGTPRWQVWLSQLHKNQGDMTQRGVPHYNLRVQNAGGGHNYFNFHCYYCGQQGGKLEFAASSGSRRIETSIYAGGTPESVFYIWSTHVAADGFLNDGGLGGLLGSASNGFYNSIVDGLTTDGRHHPLMLALESLYHSRIHAKQHAYPCSAP